MTHTEADFLIAALPKPKGLQLYRERDLIVMAGGKLGVHAISASRSSGLFLSTSWRRYIERNGTPKMARKEYHPGDAVSFRSTGASSSWLPGRVLHATPERVLIEYENFGELPRQIWKRRDEVQR